MEELVIKESRGSRTVVRLQDFQGKTFLDIRKQYKRATEPDWLDTRKGIFVEADSETLGNLSKAIRQIKKQVQGA